MLYYNSILELLILFANKKNECYNLLQSRLNNIKILQFKYNDLNILKANNITDDLKTSKLKSLDKESKYINKEINKDKFKLKYYKAYGETFKSICNTFFKYQFNLHLDTETIFTDEFKNKLLDYDKLIKHKSLYKRIQIIFIDGIDNFNQKEIEPINKQIQILKTQITEDNNIISCLDSKLNLSNKQNIDISNIEAVPKLLAEEGERPGDDDPIAQKVYDLRLLFGIGESKAMDFVKKGITFQQLITEWESFTILEAGNDILMLERLPDPPNKNIKLSTNISIDRLLHSRFNYLKERMYTEGYIGLAQCNYDQLVGIKHFKDMSQKIPRDEINKMDKYLNIIIKHINPDLIITCCGSYRRGRNRSGDMDCLLTHTKLKTSEDIDNFQAVKGSIISILVKVLTKKGFLTDHLSEGPKKYMGLCKLPNRYEYNIHRRIDIKLFPYNSYATGLLYFTGSKQLNKDMRNKALSMGMTLNEYGLYKLEYSKEKKKKVAGEQIYTPTEEDVFKILKMEYLDPTQRDL